VCTTHHPTLLTGCEDMHFVAGTMYAACLSNMTDRLHFMPGLGQREWETHAPHANLVLRHRFVAWDVATERAVALSVRGFPADADLVLHGFDINELSPTNLTVYAINHRRHGSVVEKFWHEPGTRELVWVRTIR